MAMIALKSATIKRIEALGFTIVVVTVLIIAPILWGASYNFKEDILIEPGDYKVYKLDGYEWSMLHFLIESDRPVTVCITDETGLRMLKSGEGMICLFRVDSTTSVERVWRFPKRGPLYLVIISDSTDEPTSVHLQVEGGLILW
ncbi:hypothetical protein E3E35_07585 [Thermococcus sp. GR7]|nr:hypothetical protein [Thermococcus sp. GR7]NJE78626.1 hypothetical protein [Thermococcus sp. GR4]NJF23249.1 hypothetical protein [Thermococcus sp. GR5]